ncbi:MAG: hypothetical protein R3343_09945 [Nitriliruptorales bacterium]|nr:hypothetical protein [Nitriliruptorales bacterium]
MRFRRRKPDPEMVGHVLPDDLPKKGLYAEPLRVSDIRVEESVEQPAGGFRVTFGVRVRDAEDKRAPNIAVEATIAGPERTGTGTAVTDMLGRAKFRMEGPAGRYELTVVDVAAGGLDWDPAATDLTAAVEVSA